VLHGSTSFGGGECWLHGCQGLKPRVVRSKWFKACATCGVVALAEGPTTLVGGRGGCGCVPSFAYVPALALYLRKIKGNLNHISRKSAGHIVLCCLGCLVGGNLYWRVGLQLLWLKFQTILVSRC
jgi:hypothetical protein